MYFIVLFDLWEDGGVNEGFTIFPYVKRNISVNVLNISVNVLEDILFKVNISFHLFISRNIIRSIVVCNVVHFRILPELFVRRVYYGNLKGSVWSYLNIACVGATHASLISINCLRMPSHLFLSYLNIYIFDWPLALFTFSRCQLSHFYHASFILCDGHPWSWVVTPFLWYTILSALG